MLKSVIKSLIILSFFGVVCGFIIPNYDGYITDKVGIFSETQKADLTSKIEEIEKTTSIEIAILVVPTIDGDDINLLTTDIFNQWSVGKKNQNNGLMLLIAVDDRKRSTIVGYGLEGTLPDLATKRIGEAHFPLNFREGNYYQGIVEMLDDTLGYIKQDPTIVKKYSQNTTNSSSPNEAYMGRIFIFFFFSISGFGRWVTVSSSKGKGRKMKKYGRWIFAGTGLVMSLLLTWFIANFILAAFMSYIFLLLGVAMTLGDKTGSGRGIRFGGGGGGSWGGGSSFGGFGGGMSGGGGSGGSR
ncbi:MAG: TPM domain-containing protein [Candidatus Absconditabacterales bacterium]